MMIPEATIYFTAKDGETAKISGHNDAIAAIEEIFRKAGITFDETVETWDEGFYSEQRCKVCDAPITIGELCEACARGNNPFPEASKWRAR